MWYDQSNFRELMKAFPNAKVILTVRDNPEGWYKSVKESIYKTVELNAGQLKLTFTAFVLLIL
jgi:hypothetical protein